MMKSGSKHVIGGEWNHVESRMVLMDLTRMKACFFCENDECRLCWISVNTGAAVLSIQLSIITEESSQHAFSQRWKNLCVDFVSGEFDRTRRVVTVACYCEQLSARVNFANGHFVFGQCAR